MALMHECKETSIKPTTQILLGKIGVALVIAYSIYMTIVHKVYMILAGGFPVKYMLIILLCFAFAFLLPLVHLFALTGKKVRIARTVYYIWLFSALVPFIFVGFQKVILLGYFSNFLTFWAPVGTVTIFLWAGTRGLRRITNIQIDDNAIDTVSHLLMCIGIFYGFFGGGKIAHGILTAYWSEIPHYDKVRWGLPCLVGAIGGSLFGAYVGTFIAYFVEQFRRKGLS